MTATLNGWAAAHSPASLWGWVETIVGVMVMVFAMFMRAFIPRMQTCFIRQWRSWVAVRMGQVGNVLLAVGGLELSLHAMKGTAEPRIIVCMTMIGITMIQAGALFTAWIYQREREAWLPAADSDNAA